MNKTINKKKIGKSVLSLVLVMLMLFSVIPFSASAANGGSTTGNTASPYPLPNQKDPAHDYPSAGDQGYVQLTKSAAWLKDQTNLDANKLQGYITLNTYGTPVGGGAVDIILVADISGSMSGTNNALLKATATEFVNKIFEDQVGVQNDNRVGIVLLGTGNQEYWNDTAKGFSLFQGVNQKAHILSQIQNLPASEGTSFANPLKNAKKMLDEDSRKSENRTTYVIFMTDGDPNVSGEEGYGTAAAAALKNAYSNVSIIGVGMGTSATMGNINPLCSANPDNPSQPWSYKGATTAEFQEAYDIIAGKLSQAATDVTITDYINTEHFEIDGTRPFYLDGTATQPGFDGITVDTSSQKITWKLDVVTSNGNELMIPIKFKTHDEGVFYTNKDKGDNSNLDDRAMIEYTNFQGNASRKAVESPALARPNAGVQVIYYEVDASGNPVDDSGSAATIFDQASFEARYHSLGGYTASQLKGTTENYQAAGTIKAANGNFYKLVPGAKYASNSSDNIDVTPSTNDDFIQVWFGYVKVDGATVTLNKTYNPALPSGVAPSVFTFTNTVDSSDKQNWAAQNAGTVLLAPDEVYNVTEVAAVGYKAIPSFNIKFDGTNLVCTDSAGLPAGVTLNGMALSFVNEKDESQTKTVSYKVRYYTTDGAKDVTETVDNIKVWIHDTTVPVKASDIDLTNRFTGYKCVTTAQSLPATVAIDGTVEVMHEKDDGATKEATYNVKYYLNGALKDTVPVKVDIWVGATSITVDKAQINFNDYFGAGYKCVTDPASISTVPVTNGVVEVYYEDDYSQLKDVSYIINYYKDNSLGGSKTVDTKVWVNATTITVDHNEINFVDYFGSGYKCDTTPASVTTVPVTGGTVRIDYSSDTTVEKDVWYFIQYTKDGVADPADKIKIDAKVWVNATLIPVDKAKINFTDYFGAGYACNTTSASVSSTVAHEGVITINYGKNNQTKNVKYNVEYYKDNALIDTVPQTVSVWVGATDITVDTAKINTTNYFGAGYKCVTPVSSIPATVAFDGTIEIYYEKDDTDTKDITYKVRYYLSNEFLKEVSVTESVWAGLNTVEVKASDLETFNGYKLDRTSPALPASVGNGSTITAYFVKDPTDMVPISFTVKYQDEGGNELAPDTVKTVNVWAGDSVTTVKTSDLTLIFGKIIKSVTLKDGSSISIPYTKVKDGEVITITYMDDPNAAGDITFTVEYFKAGNTSSVADFTETKTERVLLGTPYQLKESDVDGNKFPGEMIDKSATASFPIPVSDGDTAKIYFKVDQSQFKDVEYIVEYYIDNVQEEIEKVTVTGVPVTATEVDIQQITKTYPGYKMKNNPYPGTVQVGGTVKVYFEKDLSDTVSKSYTLQFHYASALTPTVYNPAETITINKTVWSGATTIDVLQADISSYIPNQKGTAPKYILNTTLTKIPAQVDVNGVIDVFYLQEMNIEVKITATVSYTSRLKGNEFGFKILDAKGTQVATGVNTSNGAVSFTMSVILDADRIGEIDDYYVSYDAAHPNSIATNPKQPDTKVYKVRAKMIMDAKGVPSLEVITYESAIRFVMK